MSTVIAFLKLVGTPGSFGFLGICCFLGLSLAWLGPRYRRVAVVWFALIVTSYVAASLPVVAFAMVNGLPKFGSAESPEREPKADMVVVLSGDNPRGRARTARQVLAGLNPECTIVSGEPWFVEVLVEEGVARERLIMDDTATTTREQIATLGHWTRHCKAQRVMVIASVVSMPRISALLEDERVPVQLVSSPLDDVQPAWGIWNLVPTNWALRVTRDALYERVALVYYRRNGWIQ